MRSSGSQINTHMGYWCHRWLLICMPQNQPTTMLHKSNPCTRGPDQDITIVGKKV